MDDLLLLLTRAQGFLPQHGDHSSVHTLAFSKNPLWWQRALTSLALYAHCRCYTNGSTSSSTATHGQPAGGLLALMSGPYGPVTQPPVDKERRINVHFRIPFLTKWGQSVVVTGTGTGYRAAAVAHQTPKRRLPAVTLVERLPEALYQTAAVSHPYIVFGVQVPCWAT